MEIVDRYQAEIAYCMSKLGQSGAVVGKSAISDIVEDAPFNWSESDKVQVKRLLESRYSIKQTRGVALVSDKHKPWLEAAKSTTDFWYWDRYQQYLLKDPDDGLPPNVVATLDKDTDKVLDLIGNPKLPGPWKFRGMVMGHVQMGKTTNYSALINKAADTGYKVIIVLAGITKTLRQQTQERLDEVFIGKESTFGGVFGDRPYPVTQYRSTPQHRWPVYGTQVQQDFTKPNARANGVSVSSLNEPIIFVLKKNISVLENLADWFDEEIALTDRVDFPMLLIDDEADNASVNTAKDPKKITRINEGIRALLSRFSRSSYVAYTATPFANIFIDPDTEDEVLEHDLFPADFIYALSPPSNYVGASRIFSESGDLRNLMLREITDYPDVLPLDHKPDYNVVYLPKSLEEAIRVFAFALTIKSQRGLGHKHSTMMINVSRFNDVQDSIAGAVYVYWDTLRRWVRMHGKDPKGGSGMLLDDLTATFNREFSDNTSSPIEDIFSEMWEAIRAVEIKTVNMRGGGLPYKEYEKNGEAYRVIAIGGLALSRGLTLEGLLVSYMLRNAAASDTLMQMARWFGYRPKYDDICRVFLPPQSIGHYEYVEEAIEELRSEINIMIARRQQPRHYGLKVRRSDTGIRITAANKMRTAERREIAADFSTKHVEGWAAYVRGEAAKANRSAVESFIQCLGKRNSATDSTDSDLARDLGAHFCWIGVDAVQINKLLNEFAFPSVISSLAPISDTSSLFSDFVRPRLQSELSSWDVIIPQKVNRGDIKNLLGLDIKCRVRGDANLESEGRSNKFIRFYGPKQRVADTNDASLLLSMEQRARAKAKKPSGARFPSMQTLFCGERERPLLIIHAVDVVVEGAIEQAVTLSFCMPATAIQVAARSYEVNKVFMNQLALDFELDLDDDDADAEE